MAYNQSDQETPKSKTSSKSYGKRPLWQWVLLYIVVGAVIYFLIYILFFNGGGTGNNGGLY